MEKRMNCRTERPESKDYWDEEKLTYRWSDYAIALEEYCNFIEMSRESGLKAIEFDLNKISELQKKVDELEKENKKLNKILEPQFEVLDKQLKDGIHRGLLELNKYDDSITDESPEWRREPIERGLEGLRGRCPRCYAKLTKYELRCPKCQLKLNMGIKGE